MYYIVPKDEFFRACKEDPFGANAHDIDETHVIVLARFSDHGQQFRFEQRAGVEALPDPRSAKSIASAHAAKLAKYGVQQGHTTLDVSDRLAEVAGHYMKLHF